MSCLLLATFSVVKMFCNMCARLTKNIYEKKIKFSDKAKFVRVGWFTKTSCKLAPKLRLRLSALTLSHSRARQRSLVSSVSFRSRLGISKNDNNNKCETKLSQKQLKCAKFDNRQIK